MCDNGRKYSFVCPVTTLFSDSIKTCDYWYNVKCGRGQEQPEPIFDERPVDQPDRGNPERNPRPEEPEPVEPEREEPEQPIDEPQPDEDTASPTVDYDSPDTRPEPPRRPVTRPPASRRPVFTPRPTTRPSGSEINNEEDENPEGDHEAEGSENQPDVIPGDEGEDHTLPEEWRRSQSGKQPKSWATFPAARNTPPTTTNAPSKWQTFAGDRRSGLGSEPTSPENNAITDQSLKRQGTSSSTPVPPSTASSEPETTEFRSENWIEQGMPSPSATQEEENGTTGSQDSNGSEDSRGSRKRLQRRDQGDVTPDDNGMIGSMMKWAAAASSALSQRQAEPKVAQSQTGPKYSVPKGPNPHVTDDMRRYQFQHASSQGSEVTSPKPLPPPPTDATLNPPYAYPYEPANAAVADDRVHVSLNERRVYVGDRGARATGGTGRQPAKPLHQSVDHPNPWTFPMTEDENTIEGAAKPRDTYRARRRDDSRTMDAQSTGPTKTGSAFDMKEAETTPSPTTTAAPFVSGVTERLPEPQTVSTSKPSSLKGKQDGNFITGEIMSNGQCRCAIPDPYIYFT